MNTERTVNHILLVGEAMEEPTFSHASHGEDFFLVPVQSLRLSGAGDLLNVLLPRTLLEQCPVRAGERVRLEGEVRSYNNRSGVGHKLVITLLARSVTWDATGADDNRVTLAGALCRRAVYRRTPPGPGDRRCHAGGEPAVRPGGLPALHRLGEHRPEVQPAGGGDASAAGGQAAKPYLHQGD